MTQGPKELDVRALSVHFEGIKAVDEVDLSLRRGEILGLIGPNGAGKTTLVNSVSGYQRATGGDVYLDDQRITGWAPARRARAGLTRSFQNVRLFSALTVFQHAEIGGLSAGLSRKAARHRAHELLCLDAVGRKIRARGGSLATRRRT